MSRPITTKLNFYVFCINIRSVIKADIEHANAPVASIIGSFLCPLTTIYSPINHITHPPRAISNAKKVAMSLSDKFCVERHKPHFFDLVKNKLDVTFANEEEIVSLIDAKNFTEVIEFAKETGRHLIITRGKKGAISIIGNEINEIGIKKDLNVVDLTGAGDLFAAGYLHGMINDFTKVECLKKGTDMSSKVIQQIGARL